MIRMYINVFKIKRRIKSENTKFANPMRKCNYAIMN